MIKHLVSNFGEIFGTAAGAILGIAFIVALLALAPFLFIWSANTLMASAGLSLYIEHTLLNYFASFVLLIVVRGSK